MKVRINAMRLQKGCVSVTRHRQTAAHGFDQRESGKKTRGDMVLARGAVCQKSA
jgi:hypothetical protein